MLEAQFSFVTQHVKKMRIRARVECSKLPLAVPTPHLGALLCFLSLLLVYLGKQQGMI